MATTDIKPDEIYVATEPLFFGIHRAANTGDLVRGETILANDDTQPGEDWASKVKRHDTKGGQAVLDAVADGTAGA